MTVTDPGIVAIDCGVRVAETTMQYDHAVERYIWPLLSLQPGPVAMLEYARLEYDAFVDAGGAKDQQQALIDKIAAAFRAQLTAALEHLPEDARAGVIV